MRHVIYYPSNAQSKMVAGARIARWLYDNMSRRKTDKYVLIDGGSVSQYMEKLFTEEEKYILYIINVPKTMIKDIPATEHLVQNANVVVWVQNDYSIWAPTQDTEGMSIVTKAFTERVVNKLPTYVWSTCGHRVDKHPEDYRYINWNALAYEPVKVFPMRRQKSSVLYYGSFREGRIKEFDKYFTSGDWVISAPKSAELKFMERYGFSPSKMLGVIGIPEDLGLYQNTLYIEDDLSHRQFHSPANRFYEAIGANMTLWIDRAAVATIEQAGYSIPDSCIVDNAKSLFAAVGNQLIVDYVRRVQKAWQLDPVTGEDHQTALKMRLKELMKEIS